MKKLIIFAVFFCVNVVQAQTETPPMPGKPRAVTIPQAVEKTLPNGLRVIVIERKNVPLVSANLIVKNHYERPATAALMSSLLMQGTRTRTAEQIAQQIEFLGASLDDYADEDASGVRLQVMSDKFDQALAIAADTIKNPSFPVKEIDLAKRQGRDEREVQLKEPDFVAQTALRRLIFVEERYGAFPSLDEIDRIKRANLIKAHQEIYRANCAILVIAGDITPVTAFALAKKHFGNWTKAREKLRIPFLRSDGTSDKLNIEKVTVIDMPDSGQAAIVIGLLTSFTRQHPKYFAGLVANSILGGGYSARLNQEIRIKRGLSYGANSSLQIFDDAGVFAAATQTKNESAAEVAEIIAGEFNKLVRKNVAAGELAARQAVLIGDFSRDLETNGGLVERVGELALYRLDLAEINSYIANVQKVTDADLLDFLPQVYGENPAHIVVAGDAKKFLPDLRMRFGTIAFDVIPAAQLDLSSESLRKIAK